MLDFRWNSENPVKIWNIAQPCTATTDQKMKIAVYTHSRRHRICTPCKSIHNVFVMLKYGNWYAIATNSFGNSKFVIKYVHHANMKCKLKICQEYKSEVPVDNKDLCVMQISNMAWKFAAPTCLLLKSKFGNELAVFANLFAYFNITNALRMHLCGLQIWCHLPWQEMCTFPPKNICGGVKHVVEDCRGIEKVLHELYTK